VRQLINPTVARLSQWLRGLRLAAAATVSRFPFRGTDCRNRRSQGIFTGATVTSNDCRTDQGIDNSHCAMKIQ
jgi:hypothetical protein